MDFATVVVGYDGSSHARRAVDAALSVTDPTGTVHLVTADDAPSAAILGVATTVDADLIVVGSRGLGRAVTFDPAEPRPWGR